MSTKMSTKMKRIKKRYKYITRYKFAHNDKKQLKYQSKEVHVYYVIYDPVNATGSIRRSRIGSRKGKHLSVIQWKNYLQKHGNYIFRDRIVAGLNRRHKREYKFRGIVCWTLARGIPKVKTTAVDNKRDKAKRSRRKK